MALYHLKGNISISIDEEIEASSEDEAWEQFWGMIDETTDRPSEIISDGDMSKLKMKRMKK